MALVPRGPSCSAAPDKGGFDFEPLPDAKEYIRLIQIHPSDNEIAPVVCSTRIVYIEGAREYAALSYMWGDPTPVAEITIDGKIMLVGRNCLYALWQRRKFQTSGAWTWIDSICIDQDDDDEKSQQVSVMGAIYEGAARVVVSLGDEEETGECIAYFARQLASGAYSLAIADIKAYSRQLVSGPWGTNTKRPKIEFANTSIEDIEDLADALTSFGNKPYWSRVWIVQELKLANRTQIICGRHEMDRIHVELLLFMDYESRLDYSSITDRLRASAMSTLFRALRRTIWIQDEVDLLTTLRCTDPRDRIFGMIHVFQWNAYGHPAVDYRRSASQIAIDVLRSIRRQQPIKGQEELSTEHVFGPKDLISLAMRFLRALEVPKALASIATDPTRYSQLSANVSITSPGTPQRGSLRCCCDEPSVVRLSYAQMHRTLVCIDAIKKLQLMPSGLRTCELLTARGKEWPRRVALSQGNPRRTCISAGVMVGDYITELSHSVCDRSWARYLVLRAYTKSIYRIVGLAVGPNLLGSRVNGLQAALLLDAEDVVTCARSMMFIISSPPASTSGGIDASNQLPNTYDIDWLSLNTFCRKPFSSCAIVADLIPQHGPYPNDHPVCAACGLWLARHDMLSYSA